MSISHEPRQRREEMKKISILTCIAFALSVAILLGGVANTNAEALNEKLKGTYAFSAIVTCSGLAPATDGLTATVHLQGQYVFYGDGNGESSFTSLTMNHNFGDTGAQPPNVVDVFGSFTYDVESNDYFVLDSNITLVGVPVTISGIMLEGRIGHGAQTLLLSDTATNVETIYRNGSFLATRTCGRKVTAVKIHRD